ncbi:MAG: hypothetical protein CMN17_07485 [Roseovarius sp.]|nr:hypothetical protein [Roseovarius sp.]MBK45061.1 hypothetical protein [Roseovarius sp.]|tara:strand:+ start:1766 stop:2083 length:318 start_codon:yes stop_codon:yes gene_type:complete
MAEPVGGISLRDGAVYLPAAAVETYFRGIHSVIVLIRDDQLMILPVRQATAGGCLLKIRNAAGDRVVQARDVFQDMGLLDLEADNLPARWDSGAGALCAPLPKKM